MIGLIISTLFSFSLVFSIAAVNIAHETDKQDEYQFQCYLQSKNFKKGKNIL